MPDIRIHIRILIGAPDQSAAPEAYEEDDAVDELRGRASHPKLVHEPMEIQGRSGELIQHKVDAVVIAKGTLIPGQPYISLQGPHILTKPSRLTAKAAAACAIAPGP